MTGLPRCPLCGAIAPVPDQRAIDRVIRAMSVEIPISIRRHGTEHVTVYEPADGTGYALTYVGGRIPASDVLAAIRAGVLRPEYPEAPHAKEWRLAHGLAARSPAIVKP